MEVKVNTEQCTAILKEFFNDLAATDQRKIFLAGFRRGAKPMIAAAKSNAPVRTGGLRRSIGSLDVPNEVAILVGAKKSGTYKGWHGHLVEYGTAQRFRRTKKDAPTGRVRGTQFFERAYNATSEQMFNSVEQEWLKEIERFIQRVNRKVKKI